MLCPKGRVGSNPTSGTAKRDGEFTVLFFLALVSRSRHEDGISNPVNPEGIG